MARRVTGCQLTQETRVQSALDNVAGPRFSKFCSPRHMCHFKAAFAGSKRVSMTCRPPDSWHMLLATSPDVMKHKK